MSTVEDLTSALRCDRGRIRIRATGVLFLLTLWCSASLLLAYGGAATAASHPQIRITEVMVNPDAVSDERGEWVEVTNLGDSDVNLLGWGLSIDNQRRQIRENFVLAVGQYAVLAENADADSNGGLTPNLQIAQLQLDNDNGTLLLMSPADEVVDSVEWGNDTGVAAPKGASLERKGTEIDAAWGPATAPWPGSSGDFGSPGLAYSPTPTETPVPATDTPAPPTETPTAVPTETEIPATVTATLLPPVPLVRVSEIMADPAAAPDEYGEMDMESIDQEVSSSTQLPSKYLAPSSPTIAATSTSSSLMMRRFPTFWLQVRTRNKLQWRRAKDRLPQRWRRKTPNDCPHCILWLVVSSQEGAPTIGGSIPSTLRPVGQTAATA